MYKIGEVVLDIVLSEDDTVSTPATSHALEDNTEMSDHVSAEPETLSINCIVIDPQNKKRELIKKYQKEGKILDYRYLSRLDHVIITNSNATRSNDYKDGYELNIEFKQIKAVKRKAIKLTSGIVSKMTANKKKMGLHVVKETKNEGKGDKKK